MNPSVLHVYRTYFPGPPGGLQEAIRQIALATGAQGLRNTIFTLTPRLGCVEVERPEARVVRARSWAAPASCDLGGPSAFKRFAELARAADVLHYYYPWPFADVLHALVRPAAPAVMTYVSDIVRQRMLGKLYAPLMWRTLRSMKIIVSNAPDYARGSSVLSHPEIRPKVRIVPLGIEEESCPKDEDVGVLDRIGLSVQRPFFLFLGVLRYYKGLQFLVEAARQVDADVVIAGSGPEGGRLQAQAAACGLKNVRFAGQVTEAEKCALLRRCKALVLPSHLRSEAFGMVLVEAAMHGRPLISCEIGTGTSFVNSDGETGIVVPPKSPLALADAMNLLLRDQPLAEAMGRSSRRRYETHFSGDVLGRAYAEVFREALA